jgi:lambda repressor-like predicted transcriptional regulator
MGPGFLGREFVSKTFQPPIHIDSIVIFSRVGEKTMRHRFNKGKRNRKGIQRPQRRGTKHRSRRPAKNNRVAPRTADEFFAMPARSREEWIRTTNVVSRMREKGISLRQVSGEFGINPRTVSRLGRSALRKGTNGRYKTIAKDRLLRVLVIPTKKGMREVATRDSQQATLVAEYWIAVHRYIDPETHDASSLRKFKGKYVTDSNGKKVPLLTDLSKLDRLASAGVLSFETIYAKR